MPTSYQILHWERAGVLEELDPNRIDAWPDIIDTLKQQKHVFSEAGKLQWIPIHWGQISVVYRTDLAPEYAENETWDILWDKKYRSRIGILNSIADTAVVAGLMAGISDMWDYRNPDDLDAAAERLNALAAQAAFASNDRLNVLEPALQRGDIVAAPALTVSYATLKNKGVPVAYMRPKECPMTFVCGLSLTDGGGDVDAKYGILNDLLSTPARHHDLACFGYAPSTNQAMSTIQEDQLASFNLSRDPTPILKEGHLQRPIKNLYGLSRAFRRALARHSLES